jgi:DNA-binding PadR family transcriptional regulator
MSTDIPFDAPWAWHRHGHGGWAGRRRSAGPDQSAAQGGDEPGQERGQKRRGRAYQQDDGPESPRGRGRSRGRRHRPDFGPFGPGFGPGFGHGFGPGGFGPRGGRARRGDVRAAILALLAERPMHGYEMIQEIGQRSNGLWRPSPGSVYPTLQLLADEGLIVGTESEGSKRLFELTDAGREAAAKTQTPPWEEIAEGADPNEVNLRAAFGQFAAAVFQSAHAATPEQQTRILDIVNNARRDIYGVLGEAD